MDTFPSHLMDELARVYAEAAVDAYLADMMKTLQESQAEPADVLAAKPGTPEQPPPTTNTPEPAR